MDMIVPQRHISSRDIGSVFGLSAEYLHRLGKGHEENRATLPPFIKG
jgi:hypothetical protein